MRTIVAGHLAFSWEEFAELAWGIDPLLFTGLEDETEMERAARLDAARDILADLWREDAELAAYAARLMGATSRTTSMPELRTAERRWAA
ncbi:hypothetical protein [Yinghuangia seranimata]|uniref:hypothetical protein n=1 Tax=Yinghuangia seranimata TaxID=408067 RepID=UPI00248CAAA9|nr:hypothetical protein [Yinghuangia seranimata]MDI2127801.1 hypothetical protein [Yinghuangia seranimata]